MAKQKEQTPPAVSILLENYNLVKKKQNTIIHNFMRTISDAYTTIIGEDGLVDYNLLEEEDYKKKFKKTFNEKQTERTFSILGFPGEEKNADDFTKNWMNNIVNGQYASPNFLNTKLSKDLTLEKYFSLLTSPENMSQITRHFSRYMANGLKTSDQNTLIEYAKAGKAIDNEKLDDTTLPGVANLTGHIISGDADLKPSIIVNSGLEDKVTSEYQTPIKNYINQQRQQSQQ